jgi:hypothetical protein
MNRKIKNAPRRLTQAEIDGLVKSPERRHVSWRETLAYLNGTPGAILTIVVFALFVLGMTYLMINGMPEVYRTITAGRG